MTVRPAASEHRCRLWRFDRDFDWVRMGRINTPAAAPEKAGKKPRDNHSLEQLKEENQKLRDLAEWRSATMAHLGHELRTPLTSILGFSEILLSQEQLTDAQRNFCERIQTSAQQLQRTLNHMTDLSRMDAPSDDNSSSR